MKKNNIKKALKILIMVFCVIFVFATLVNAIISADIFHISLCNLTTCEKCLMIQNADYFSKIINYIITYIAMLNAAIPLVYIITKNICIKKKETLVTSNVMLIE